MVNCYHQDLGSVMNQKEGEQGTACLPAPCFLGFALGVPRSTTRNSTKTAFDKWYQKKGREQPVYLIFWTMT